MGCTQSLIENEEVMTRCKERKHLLRQAISSRNAFASAHSAYAIGLKSTGAALCDYAHGETREPTTPHPHHDPSSSSAPAAVPSAVSLQPPVDNLPPPPPPLPDFNQSPLLRAASMPQLPIPNAKKKPPADDTIREEEDSEEDLEAVLDEVVVTAAATTASPSSSSSSTTTTSAPPRRPPPQLPPVSEPKSMDSTWDYFFGISESMPGPTLEPHPQPERIEIEESSSKKLTVPPPPVETVIRDEPPAAPEKVVIELPPGKPARKGKQLVGSANQQHVASASSSGALDSKRGRMVPAAARSVTLLQVLNELDVHFLKAYESAQEVTKMLEATRMHYHSDFSDNRGHIDHSAEVMRVITWNRSNNPDYDRDAFGSEKLETHGTVLDKMLAWEKKLYHEVKASELMKLEYQRKVTLLNKQTKRGANAEVLGKTKSAVSHLRARYTVDIQSMDATVSEINRLRDDRLYPKLVELVNGMAKMWESMYVHHGNQLQIAADLKALNISVASRETSEHHHHQTIQLWGVLREWHSQFQKLTHHQKDYIRHLNSWLRLNIIPIETGLKERVPPAPRVAQPPIQALLRAWHDQLEKLPDELARNAIFGFSEVIHMIVVHQEDELKQREIYEETHREYMRKVRTFEDWHRKYMEKRASAAAPEEADPERSEGANQNDPVEERKISVLTLKARLDSELEAHQKLKKQVRDKSLGSLRTHLPELFRTMSNFSLACFEMYKKLALISQQQNPEGN